MTEFDGAGAADSTRGWRVDPQAADRPADADSARHRRLDPHAASRGGEDEAAVVEMVDVEDADVEGADVATAAVEGADVATAAVEEVEALWVRQPETADEWDDHYRATDLVWGEPPTPWIVEQTTVLPPGRVLDVGAAEGHNAIWLATRAWDVTAVDISRVGLDKGATVASRAPRSVRARLRWLPVDVLTEDIPDPRYDLIVWAYVQLSPGALGVALHRVCETLPPGGVLLLVGHATKPLRGGTRVEVPVYDPDTVAAALPEDMVVEHVEWLEGERGHGTGTDLAVRARRRGAHG